MPKVNYLRGVLGNAELIEEHKDSLIKLLSGDYTDKQLEKLQGYDAYSFREGKRPRLIFTRIRQNGKYHLLVLDYLDEHQYAEFQRKVKSGSINYYIQQYAKDPGPVVTLEELQFEPIAQLPENFLAEEGEELELAPVDFFNERYIEFSLEQEAAISMQLPGVISGVAGGGKTSVAVAAAIAKLKSNPSANILYVTTSEELVNLVKTNWNAQEFAQEAWGRISFKTYQDLVRDFLIAMDPAPVLISREQFNAWANETIKHLSKVYRTKKDESKLAVISGLNPDQLYQEFRIISGFTQEIYTGENFGVRNTLFASVESRKFLYGLYTDFLGHLKPNEIMLDFYRLPHQNLYDFVFADESQDFSLLQLANLKQIARNGQSIIYFLDPNQRLFDLQSVRPYLFQTLGIPSKNHVELLTNHRCPPVVNIAAETVRKLKAQVISGDLDKYSNGAIVIPPKKYPGHIFVLEQPQVDSQPQWLLQTKKGSNFIVVTYDDKETVRKLFNCYQVYTPEEVKGLENEIVVAYNLPEDLLKDIRNIADGPRAAAIPLERIIPYLHSIYTTVTRSTGIFIYITKKINPNNRVLLDPLIEISTKEFPTPRYLDQELEHQDNWEELVIKLINKESTTFLNTAELIYNQELQKIKGISFAEFRASLYQTPVLVPEPVTPPTPVSPPQDESVREKNTETHQASAKKRKNKNLLPKTQNLVLIPEPKFTKKFSDFTSLNLIELHNNLSAANLAKSLNSYGPGIIFKEFTLDGKSLNLAEEIAKKLPELIAELLNNPELLVNFPIQKLYYLQQYFIKNNKKELSTMLSEIFQFKEFFKEFENQKDTDDLLVAAAQENEYSLLTAILKYLKPNYDYTAVLFFIVEFINESAAIELLKFFQNKGLDLSRFQDDGDNLITYAAFHGKGKILEFISSFMNINKQYSGRTAIHIAVEQNNIPLVKTLISLKADLNQKDSQSYTPADIAAEYGYVDILKLLHKAGLKFKAKSSELHPAVLACRHGKIEVLSYFQSISVNLNLVKDEEGKNLAHIAILEGKPEMVRKLKNLGVNVDIGKDNWKEILENISQEFFDLKMLLAMLETGLYIPLNKVLHSIFENELIPADQLITLKKALPLSFADKLNDSGLTLLHIALRNKNRDYSDFLLADAYDSKAIAYFTKEELKAWLKPKSNDADTARLQRFLSKNAGTEAKIAVTPVDIATIFGLNIFAKYKPFDQQNYSLLKKDLSAKRLGICLSIFDPQEVLFKEFENEDGSKSALIVEIEANLTKIMAELYASPELLNKFPLDTLIEAIEDFEGQAEQKAKLLELQIQQTKQNSPAALASKAGFFVGKDDGSQYKISLNTNSQTGETQVILSNASP